MEDGRRAQQWRMLGLLVVAHLRYPFKRPSGWHQWLGLSIVVLDGLALGLGLLVAWDVGSPKFTACVIAMAWLIYFFAVTWFIMSSSTLALMHVGIVLIGAAMSGLFFYPIMSAIGLLSCAGGALGLVFTGLFIRAYEREQAARVDGESCGNDGPSKGSA